MISRLIEQERARGRGTTCYCERYMRREEETPDCMREMRKDMGKRISGWDEEGPEFWTGLGNLPRGTFVFFPCSVFHGSALYKEE
jgi:hypothetical protein